MDSVDIVCLVIWGLALLVVAYLRGVLWWERRKLRKHIDEHVTPLVRANLEGPDVVKLMFPKERFDMGDNSQDSD